MNNFYGKISGRLLPVVIVLFTCFTTGVLLNAQPCSCTNCPQFMPDNFTGQFLINVSNAANPILGQNGQGICGVTLNFDHEYVGDLQITLTAPSGQSVTLVGPIGLFGETDGTSWNITFLPCADPVSPDPGFAGNWSNAQNWGLGGMYTGSYHPSNGCLENITGPVNGTWTLTVVDGQASDVGNFLDYSIIFCDPSGIACFSCAANAGNLLQPDVAACEGSSSLDLDLPPSYTAQSPAPPASEYTYTYAIGGPGGVLLDYDPNADLSAYPPGIYTVCGVSVLAAQEGMLPPPNGALTINQLRTMLSAATSQICARVSVNCVNVTINAAPPDEEEFVEICAPQCYFFHGSTYCSSGTYTKMLTVNNCDYMATLYLTVAQPSFHSVTEVICEGDCSSNPAFPGVCTPGSYTEQLMNAAGCDSMLTLNLTVLSATANIANNPIVPCGGGTVQLQGTGSSIGGGYSYTWSASNGGTLVGPVNQINANASTAGTYQLKVCRTSVGVMCCDSTEIELMAATDPPEAPGAIGGFATLCSGQTFNYNIAPVSGASSYTWTVPPGVTINSGANSLITNITWSDTTGGEICVTASNDCGESPESCLSITVNNAPVTGTLTGPDTICGGVNGTYTVGNSATATSYNWTVPAPATIVSGQGTNTVEIAWNGATNSNICVAASNSCGSGAQQCLPVTILALPTTPAAISGNNTACSSAQEMYSIAPVAGAVSYTWTVTGGVITSGNGTPAVNVTWNANATSGMVCVKSVNNCGESMEICFNVMLSSPPPSPVIAGPDTLCAGANGTYTVNAITGATGYVWTVPAGATIVSGQNTTSIVVTWNQAPGGNIGISVNGSCGTAPQVNYPVIIHPIPTPNAGADQVLCGTSATLAGTGMPGIWTQTAGPGTATFATPNAPGTGVTVSMPGAYTFQWAVNTFGCAANDAVNITFNSIPVAGPHTWLCNGTNDFYTVSFSVTGGTAPFSVAGGTVTGGVFTSDSMPSGQAFSFVITDANGCMTQPVAASHLCNCATDAGTMAAALLEACENETVTAAQQTPAILDVNDIGVFVLHEGAGTILVNILAQNTTGIFGLLPGMVPGQTYYISYVAGNDLNGAPDPSDPCLSVSVGQPVVFHAFPLVNAGTNQSNCGDSLQLNAAGTGVWTVLTSPVGGLLQFSGTTDSAATVLSNISGTYTVQWTVTSNGCSSTDTVGLMFNENPVISNVQRDCDAANENFTVSFDITGGTAPYNVNTVPVAGNTFSGTAVTNGGSYTYLLTDANGCMAPALTGSFSCNCATDAGTMATAPLKACEGNTVQAVANNDQVLDGNDIVSYILHDQSGATLGAVLDENTTGTFGFLPGMTYGQTYYISRAVGNPGAGAFPDPNDPCFAIAPGQPVLFLENPTPDAGTTTPVCGTTMSLNAAPGFPGDWTLVSGPGTAVFDPATSGNSTVTVATTGVYVFRWSETNDICVAESDVSATFNAFPMAAVLSETCNSTNTSYTIEVDISGGTAPYTVSGLAGTVTGGLFTSDLIINNTPYAVQVTDVNGCEFGPVEGIKNCNCLTDAGTMVMTPLVFCEGTPAVAVWNNNAQLDGDDIVAFILHSTAGGSLGQVEAVSATPEFAFMPNYVLGQTYYISAIAGNDTGGDVDLTDGCLSISSGTPVKWKPLPTASLMGDNTICEGSASELQFTGTGTFPLSISWNDGTDNQTTTIGASGTTVATVTPGVTTQYQLLMVSDGTLPTCAVDLTDAVTVTVNTTLTAGSALPAPDFCAGAAQTLILADLLSGADASGVWTDISAIPAPVSDFNAATGSLNTANLLPGTYQFRYTVTPLAPCLPDSSIVSVSVRPKPVADAGADALVDCNTDFITLGGGATSTGAGVSYTWAYNTTPLPDITPAIAATAAGAYQLTVTNSFGCTASDAVVVNTDNDIPVIDAAVVKNISCFGWSDGRIEVQTVTGGVPPYLYSLNGGVFSNKNIFTVLPAGTYILEVMSSNGCISAPETVEIQEPPLLAVTLGPDVSLKLGDSLTVMAEISIPVQGLDSIAWNPVFDTSGIGTLQQSWSPLRTSSVDIWVRDSNGCTANDRLLIFVDSRRHIYVPNIFTPSGSENNTLLIYGGQEVAEITSFQVFDRWGEMVFEEVHFQPNDPSKAWNGGFRNKETTPGVYIWSAVVLFKDGESELFTGDVTIIR